VLRGRKEASEAPLAVDAAREAVLAATVPAESESVALARCLDRVAASAVRSAVAAPPFDNSAMDGYALRGADTEGEARPLRLVGESRAGHPAEREPGAGEAVRISTGAMMPASADAVLRLEHATESDGTVLAENPVAGGENVRRAGEDFRPGDLLVEAGRRLGPAELGLLAAAGVTDVDCARRPRVAVMTSGDELVALGGQLGPGQIYDSNRYSLLAQVAAAGADADYGGNLPDDPAAVRAAIEPKLDADAVVVAGGVSVGRHDHVKGALAELGVEERFWRVALRPGGPTWFGVLPAAEAGQRPTLVFGLPGNPVSAMVTFHLFARPALLAMVGLPPLRERVSAILAEDFRKQAGRAHYVRCRLEPAAGGLEARLTGAQGSHVISSMAGADGLAAIPAERELVEAGESVEVELLR
jgi:molybdopterin molybdotransferase